MGHAGRSKQRDARAGERGSGRAARDVHDVLEDEGALRARLTRAPPKRGLDADPEEPHPTSVHEGSHDECAARRRSNEQEVA